MKCIAANCKRDGKNYGKFAGIDLIYCGKHKWIAKRLFKESEKIGRKRPGGKNK